MLQLAITPCQIREHSSRIRTADSSAIPGGGTGRGAVQGKVLSKGGKVMSGGWCCP